MTLYALNGNVIFDRFLVENKEPESGNSGLMDKPLDLDRSGSNGNLCTPILADVPNLYKHNGASVSENLGYFIIPKSVFFDSRFQGARLKYQKVLITLLAKSAFAPTTHAIGCEIININIGQFCVSELQLVDLCNEGVKFKEDKVDKNIIHRAVQFWCRCGFVNQQVIHGKNLLTITIPEFYERNKIRSEPASESKVNQNRTTKEEDKEDKEDNIILNVADAPDSAIAPSEKKKIYSSSKRKKIDPEPKIERDKGVFITQTAHNKLVESRGGEDQVKKIYAEMAVWKAEKGIQGGSDYATANKWHLNQKSNHKPYQMPQKKDCTPKPLNYDLEARLKLGGLDVTRRQYDMIEKEADLKNRPEDKKGYNINEPDGRRTKT